MPESPVLIRPFRISAVPRFRGFEVPVNLTFREFRLAGCQVCRPGNRVLGIRILEKPFQLPGFENRKSKILPAFPLTAVPILPNIPLSIPRL